MAVQIKIDQAAKPAGVAGQAREDLDVATAVTLAAVGGPFSQYQWTLIDAPPNATLTSPSTSTLSAPTASTTQITPDNDGTYLVELAVDAGFGLGARPEDVTRRTFYAGATLNPIIDQLPRRVMSFREQLEHNVPNPVEPTGNTTGWAFEWQKWFKVIALAMTSGLTPPVNPGENNQIAYGLNGNLAYAAGVLIAPGSSETALQIGTTDPATTGDIRTNTNFQLRSGAAGYLVIGRATGGDVLIGGDHNATSGALVNNIDLNTDDSGALNHYFDYKPSGPGIRTYHQRQKDKWRIVQLDDDFAIMHQSTTALVDGHSFFLEAPAGNGTDKAGGWLTALGGNRTGTGAYGGVSLGYGSHTSVYTEVAWFSEDAISRYMKVGLTGATDHVYVRPNRIVFTSDTAGWGIFAVPRTSDNDANACLLKGQDAWASSTNKAGGDMQYFSGIGTGTAVHGKHHFYAGDDTPANWSFEMSVSQTAARTAYLKIRDTANPGREAELYDSGLTFGYGPHLAGCIWIKGECTGGPLGFVLPKLRIASGAGLSNDISGADLEIVAGAGAGTGTDAAIRFLTQGNTSPVSGTQRAFIDNDGLSIDDGRELRLWDPGSSNYISFKAPALTANTAYTLPVTDGSPNQQLTTDGAGNLTWQSGTVGGVSSVFGRTGAVVAALGDYAASQVTNDSGVTGSEVDAALDWLDTNKAGLTSTAPVNVTKAAAAVGVGTTAARHDHKHDVTTGTPSTVQVQSNAEGSSPSLARADHLHQISTAAPAGLSAGGVQVGGTSVSVNRADHEHAAPVGTPVAVSTANSAGVSGLFVRADHVHNHGNQSISTHHAVASGSINGFVPTVGASGTVLQSNGSAPYWATNLDLAGSIDMNDNPVFAVRDLTFQQEYSESGTAIPFDVEQFVVKTLSANATLTFDTPTGPCHRQLRVVQGSGPYTITWPSVEWVGGGTAPTLSTGNGDVDIFNFFYNGSTWYGQAGLDFA